MKFLSKSKDGGPESTVTAYNLIELKGLFTIALLKFDGKSREAYHTHAFNSISWLLKGQLIEHTKDDDPTCFVYTPHINPIITRRDTFHKVDSQGVSWALTFRGPWVQTWRDQTAAADRVLTWGRVDANL